MNRWETEFWKLLSPDTARRLKIELGIGSDTTDANSAPPAVHSAPEPTGGALLPGTLICLRETLRLSAARCEPSAYAPGKRVQMHIYNNTRIKRGKIRMSFPDTPPDHRRVEWDDDYGTSTEPVTRLELIEE